MKNEVFKRENDQSTYYHKIFYDWARTPEFTSLYDLFAADVVQPIYNDKIVYQAIPTFRLALLDNVAVGGIS